MKKILLATAIALFTSSAMAMTEPSFEEVDANADGFVTLEELEAVEQEEASEDAAKVPEMLKLTFDIFDLDQDGKLNKEEFEMNIKFEFKAE